MFMLWTAGILKKCLVLFKIPRSHNPLINCLNSLIFLVFRYYMHDFFFVVKEREGENFDLKISWVDFGITFFKKRKRNKKSIEDGSLVVFVFKNLIGWNTVLVIWKIHIGRIACPKSTFQLGRKIIQGETKQMVQFASLDFCFTL